jgi:pyrimidine-specific ribonucleoside hydrolase
VEFIIETVRSQDGVTLVPVGPLTNIGAALRRAPDIAGRITEISLMGGSVGGGNTTAAAEFNIFCDPEAAHIVFDSGIPIKMSGLNVTRQAAATAERRRRIRDLGNHTGQVVADWLDFFSARVKAVFNIDGGSLHDAVAVAWLIDPTLVESRMMHVAVELKGGLTRGMTVCDQRYQGYSGGGIHQRLSPNVDVGLMLDVERFFNLLIDALATHP